MKFYIRFAGVIVESLVFSSVAAAEEFCSTVKSDKFILAEILDEKFNLISIYSR